MKPRLFSYRVYFTLNPRAYYLVNARNVEAAVKQAKQVCRAMLLTKKRRKLEVDRVERLYAGETDQGIFPANKPRSKRIKT